MTKQTNHHAEPAGYTWVSLQGSHKRLLLADRDADQYEAAVFEAKWAAKKGVPGAPSEPSAAPAPSAELPTPDQLQDPVAPPVAQASGEEAKSLPLTRYRVVHDLDRQRDRILAESALRTPDMDVQKRQEGIARKLGELGPDRRVALPTDEGEALEEMRAIFPNCAGPLDLVSDILALTRASGQPLRIPPMLLLGPPGVGKTYFSQRLAEILGAPFRRLSMDQMSGTGHLMGSDAYWSNSRYGVLFEMLCLGEVANPIILLDEVDKASNESAVRGYDTLAQLHSVLEPETSRRACDQSTGVEFDASLVTYIATANSIRGIEPSILSRFEVFEIALPEREAALAVARSVWSRLVQALNLVGKLTMSNRALCVAAHLSPRLMTRLLTRAAGAAVAANASEVTEEQMLRLFGLVEDRQLTH